MNADERLTASEAAAKEGKTLAPFKVGDVVCLKSGGPPMTVSLVYGEHSAVPGHVDCRWFVGDTPRADVFPVAALVMGEVVRYSAGTPRKTRTDDQRCDRCRWWDRSRRDATQPSGMCRRFPPCGFSLEMGPVEWCGEWCAKTDTTALHTEVGVPIAVIGGDPGQGEQA